MPEKTYLLNYEKGRHGYFRKTKFIVLPFIDLNFSLRISWSAEKSLASIYYPWYDRAYLVTCPVAIKSHRIGLVQQHGRRLIVFGTPIWLPWRHVRALHWVDLVSGSWSYLNFLALTKYISERSKRGLKCEMTLLFSSWNVVYIKIPFPSFPYQTKKPKPCITLS